MNNVICTCKRAAVYSVFSRHPHTRKKSQGLLTWRLWRMSRAVLSREQRQGLRSVARIIAESGAITTLAWVTYITLNALHQPAAVILLNSVSILSFFFCNYSRFFFLNLLPPSPFPNCLSLGSMD